MIKMARFVLAPILMLAAVVTAQAEEKIKIEEVVVTATRYEENVADVPASVSYITEKDIRNSPALNVPDLLRTEAGIQVSDITGNGRSFFVDLRGFGETAPSNTLVLVDGRRINEPDLSGVDWTLIPLERVSRIEIIRGGRGSVLYGDNATAGVVNIITKEGAAGFTGGIDLSGGSFGTFATNGYASGRLKDFSFRVSGSYLDSQGYRDNSKTDPENFGLNTTYSVKDYMKIDLSAGYHKDRTGLPGALKQSDFDAGAAPTDTKFPNDFAKTEDYYLKFGPEVYLSENVTLRLDTSFRRREFLSFNSGDFGDFLGNSVLKTVAASPQVIFTKNFGKIKNTLTAGFDYQRTDEDIRNDSLFFGTQSLGLFTLKKDEYGFYGHDEVAISDALHISGGYRHDRAEFTFAPSTPESVSMNEDAYTAGINYTFYKKSYAYASYSKSFRYPLLDELYSFFNNTINTALGPQTSDNYEIGVRYYLTDAVFLNVNVFRLDTNSEIFFNPVTFSNENLDGLTRREGIEFSFDARATSWLTVRGSYTLLNAKIKEGAFTGSDIPNVPAHKATMEVTCHMGKGAAATLNGIYVGARPFVSDFPNDFSNQQSYYVLNAKFSYRWKSLRAYVDIHNLTNRSYSEFGVIGGVPLEQAFYPSPNRNFLAGLAVDF